MIIPPNKTLLRPRFDNRSNGWMIYYERYTPKGEDPHGTVGWCKFSNLVFNSRDAAIAHIITRYIDIYPDKYALDA
ncbi:MAG TPA: hypothetical protein PKE03_10360 [Bacteroidales bacterium]|nr:hypothetical protein [Bacteroidales bacterium]